ncbi:TetR/AcrR family transcriptional regulator [uncultured Massilia sp.]|uniref:TetR/AcrR family transcriptional regulator n=1 Tax=uncultured Massilia sp. TaxID=169973 RepID=UPI0025E0F090|nr:TetR/AcrR family transcriptional regulator [uncultured Massilia sp.]
MARTKVFDPAAALEAAMQVFWEQGYEATSTDDLLRAMGIGRQSMYDTFGDKKQLYLAALERYTANGGADLRRRLAGGPSPLGALEAFLRHVAGADAAQCARGCLSVNTVAEFGQADPAVGALIAQSQRVTEAIFEEALRRAGAAGELAPGVDPAAAAHFIHTAIRGMRISAKAGAGAAQLEATVDFTLAALRRG